MMIWTGSGGGEGDCGCAELYEKDFMPVFNTLTQSRTTAPSLEHSSPIDESYFVDGMRLLDLNGFFSISQF